jgi:hypothetical protein
MHGNVVKIWPPSREPIGVVMSLTGLESGALKCRDGEVLGLLGQDRRYFDNQLSLRICSLCDREHQEYLVGMEWS